MPPEPERHEQKNLGELASSREDARALPWPPGPTLRPPEFGQGREHNRSVMQMQVLVPAYALSDMHPLTISSRMDTSAFRGIDHCDRSTTAPSAARAATAAGAALTTANGAQHSALEPVLLRRLSAHTESSFSSSAGDGSGAAGGAASGVDRARQGTTATGASSGRRQARSPVRRSSQRD